MEFLKLLESIRNPILDAFFSLVTVFGEETVFIVVALIWVWCINKHQGYYILFVGLIGTVLNQFLKITFKVERPWVKDPNFTVVESAKPQATGYSFPSGHSQCAVGTFSSIALSNKSKALRIFCLVICILVPLSRMYLGVHTPLDTVVGALIAFVTAALMKPIMDKAKGSIVIMRVTMALLMSFSLAYVGYCIFLAPGFGVDPVHLADTLSDACKMSGCFAGLWISFEVDRSYIHFDTEGSLLTQVIKASLGLAIAMLIKSLTKEPLLFLFEGSDLAHAVRYFLVAIFAGCIWPLTFTRIRYFCEK
ncbi:MAG: phosphatase PAP2 family protein [Ruminococcaceae bacterium]|nr:phosphatase PAP2 family protein [Oscillospiraceae bacterium]